MERPTLITVLSAFAMNRYQDFSVSGPLSSRFKFLWAEPSCLPWLTTRFPAPERAERLHSRPSPDCDQQDSPSGKFKKQAQEEWTTDLGQTETTDVQFTKSTPVFFFFFKLYKIVLVLPNIKMNPPQVETAKETLMYRTVLWGTHVYSSF